MLPTSKDIYAIVPTILQEASENGNKVVNSASLLYRVASHFGLTDPAEMGVFDSGKPKMGAFVNNALKKMIANGDCKKVGRGKYTWIDSSLNHTVQPPPAPAPAPVVIHSTQPTPPPPPTPTPTLPTIEVVEPTIEVVKPAKPTVQVIEPTQVETQLPMTSLVMSTTLYDIRDEATINFFANNWKCWAKFKATDEACRACPLSDQCDKAKLALAEKKKAEKEAKAKREEEMKNVGIEPAQLNISPEANLSDAIRMNLHNSCLCQASGRELKVGEEAFFVPNWGAVGIEEGLAIGISI